ncbi:MAG: hypothetical protein ACHQIM_00630 [Sphingobacteriales bacterium]
MNVFILSIQVLLCIAVLLFIGVLFFSFLKFLKKAYFPKWKFPDYISVGYAEYLYKKFIKKPIAHIKERLQ